jgi:hypothetical protein
VNVVLGVSARPARKQVEAVVGGRFVHGQRKLRRRREGGIAARRAGGANPVWASTRQLGAAAGCGERQARMAHLSKPVRIPSMRFRRPRWSPVVAPLAPTAIAPRWPQAVVAQELARQLSRENQPKVPAPARGTGTWRRA